MNILHISPYVPSVFANHAGGVCMGKEVEALIEENNVYVLTFVSNQFELDLIRENKVSCNFIDYIEINMIKRIISIILNPLKPNYFAARSSLAFYHKMIDIIELYKIDAIHAEYASMGQYIRIKKKFPNIVFNLVEHDITIQSYNRKILNVKSIFKKIYFNIQKYLIQKSEKKYCLQADKVITFNEKDKNMLINEYMVSRVEVMPPYYGMANIIPNYKRNVENNICFMGQMGRPENYMAAIRLINIFNEIVNIIKDSKLFIIGNNPPYELKKLENENIFVTGYVENVDEYINKCKVAVFPLTLGAGIKVKVLKSMALGTSVITTDVGAEGIDEKGEALIICRKDEEFQRNILELLSNDEKYVELSKRQTDFVSENFSWDISVNLLKNFYKVREENI